MTEELTKAIGISPSLQIENWSEEKLKHQNILAQINAVINSQG
jgi:hypothetical protein